MIRKHTRKAVVLIFVMALSILSIQAQQNTETFADIYLKTLNEYVNKDPDLALRIADSLFENSSSPNLKVRSLMLKAFVYKQLGDVWNSIQCTERAIELSSETKDHEWSLKALGFMASQYQSVHLIEKSEVYLEKAMKELSYIEDKNLYNSSLNTIYKAKAINALDKKEYEVSMFYLKQSDSLISILPNLRNKEYFRTTSRILKGRVYYELSEYDLSEKAYLESKQFLDKFSNEGDPLYNQIYTGLGNLAFKKGENDLVVWKFYAKAIHLVENSSQSHSRIFLYESLLKYFSNKKDWENYQLYNEKLLEERAIVEEIRNQTVVGVFNEMLDTKLIGKHLVKVYSLIILFLTVVFFFLTVVLRRKKARDKIKYLAIISNLEDRIRSEDVVITDSREVFEEEEESFKGNKSMEFKISKEVEESIWKKIVAFEKQLFYLDSSVSIAFLASHCETNVKYVSYVLKKHTGKNFNTYINELKVYYIIQKLKEDKVYRSYKISYLAEVAGFSSHSVFSSVFKQTSGLSPSAFINLLEEE